MEGGTWWIIIGAIAAIMVVGIIIYIAKGGLFSGKKSIDFLGTCKAQGGTCSDYGRCGGSKPIRILVSGDCESHPSGDPRNNICCLKADGTASDSTPAIPSCDPRYNQCIV